MRLKIIALTISMVLVGTTVFAADTIAWGTPANGLRLGIRALCPGPDRALEVVLENAGPMIIEVMFGVETGKGVASSFRFSATNKNGTQLEGVDLNNFIPIGGLVLPKTLRLTPGESQTLKFELKKIICTAAAGPKTFEAPSWQGDTFLVSLEVDEKSAEWARLYYPWIGKVASGAVQFPE